MYVAIRIGFAQLIYTFLEPDFQLLVTEVTLIKEDDTISEQTFGVIVSVSNPTSTPSASLESTDNATSFDYSLGSGDTELRFPPNHQSIMFTFFLTPDDLPEGTEGFQASSTSASSSTFPTFQSPLNSDIPDPRAFLSTEIQIIDNDCKS